MEKYTHAFDEVLNVLDQFSPTVEAGSLGSAFLDGSGLERLFGSDSTVAERICSEVLGRTLLEPRIGVGSGKSVAGLAATAASRRCPVVVEAGEEKRFLASMPTDLLPVSDDTRTRLRFLGLRSMEQVAAIPLDALVEQFGEEGRMAYRLANGEDDSPLIPGVRPAVLGQEMSFDSPVETVDSLLAIVEKLLDGLLAALWERHQGCSIVRMAFHFDSVDSQHESVTLKEPTASGETIMLSLKSRLESMEFPAGVTGVYLALTRLGGESGRQGWLSAREPSRQEEQLKRVARHLQVKFGENPLKKVLTIDPDSRIPERRSVLADFV